MPADDPREPRFDTTPAPRLGPADPLQSRRPPVEEPPEEPGGALSAINGRTLTIGLGAAAILTLGIVWAVRHQSSPPPAPPPAASAPATSAPAETGSSESPTPAQTTTPAQTPAQAPAPPAPSSAAPAQPVSRPPAAPAPAALPAPPPSKPAAAKPAAPADAAPAPLHPSAQHGGKTAAVAPSVPKHKRHGAAEAGDWLVQVGAYRTQDHAALIVDTLTKHGWKAHTVKGHSGWILVEITGYRTKAEAQAAATSLAAKEHVPTLVRQVVPKTGQSAH
jgi:cell division protein FtsN